MKVLNHTELNDVVGGNIWVGLGIVAFIIFIAGVIDGYTNPGRCNSEEN